MNSGGCPSPCILSTTHAVLFAGVVAAFSHGRSLTWLLPMLRLLLLLAPCQLSVAVLCSLWCLVCFRLPFSTGRQGCLCLSSSLSGVLGQHISLGAVQPVVCLVPFWHFVRGRCVLFALLCANRYVWVLCWICMWAWSRLCCSQRAGCATCS
jgi:hypothetical protein